MARAHVIVVGLGAVGSATAWRLAAAGHRVTGLDRWRPPHSQGSTHGESRVTRVTAWEGARYVPLAQRANRLWDELAESEDAPLGARTGGIFVGRDSDRIVSGSRASAVAAGLPHEIIAAEEIARRVSGLAVPEGMVGFVDPDAGVLFPERIVVAMHARARSMGADLRYDEPMHSWRADGDGVRVSTARGEISADRLVLATGAWMGGDLGALGVDVRIERQTMHWFDAPSTAAHSASDEHRPVLIMSDGPDHATVIFPVQEGLVKVAGHGSGETTAPDAVDRTIRDGDIAPVAAVLARAFPARYGAHRRGACCLYTCTPDGHFIVDRHPQHSQVVLASPCNGFGFKFASAVGEGVAAMATGERCPVALDSWRLR